jgi:MoaA/NifB/PqqE/SkfB family radical SAM enzyme
MHSYKGRFEPTRFEDLTVTVDFHCHSACRFCIVQEGMNYFKGVPFETFQRAVDDNRATRRYRRVTFTGGEVTLDKKLFDYIAYARESGSFDEIRLQTNGRLLADMAFAKKLVDAGVTEFFVSLHGHDAATQDHISQRPGSFAEAMAGMQNIVELGACLMTNTVLTKLNQPYLADIVETVRPLRPTRMEFWNYLPMEDYADDLDLLSPMEELAPSLRAALDRCATHGIEAVVKYVPRCLLGEHARTQDNTQPDVVIVEAFYDMYPKFACLYEAKCEYAETCLGLHHPYITKYGWEKDLLTPFPRTTEWEEPEYGLWVGSDKPGEGTAPATDQPVWAALVEGVAEQHGAMLDEIVVQRRACVYRFRAGDASVDVVLTTRDEEGPALARTRSFNVHYRNVRGDAREAKEALSLLVRSAVESVREKDPGGMLLDARKGLVGPDSVRGRKGAPKSSPPR